MELYADKKIPDITGLLEQQSWTKPDIMKSELALGSYRLFRIECANQKPVGHGAREVSCMLGATLMQ